MDRIVMSSQESLDFFESEAIEFFSVIFNLSYMSCFVSDISELADFASHVWPENKPLPSELSVFDYECDLIVLNRIKAHYGIELESTKITFVELFQLMQSSTLSYTLH